MFRETEGLLQGFGNLRAGILGELGLRFNSASQRKSAIVKRRLPCGISRNWTVCVGLPSWWWC